MNDDQERGDSSPNTGRQSTVNVNGDSKCEEKAFSANLSIARIRAKALVPG